MRKIAREIGMKRESARLIAKKQLGLKPYKLQDAQLLTPEMETTRRQRAKDLLQRFAGQEILFTDEKIFTVEAAHNRQNDRIWASESPLSSGVVGHSQHPASVMVWAGICKTGKTPLIFVEEGAKINKDVYLRDILQAVVKPWTKRHFGSRPWVFQQDSAPAHKAREVQDWCRTNFPGFISTQEWPPYSPDLNPMDYSVWAMLEARACSTSHKNLESLRLSLEKEWKKISVKEVRTIAKNFFERLSLCIKAKGGHFENS